MPSASDSAPTTTSADADYAAGVRAFELRDYPAARTAFQKSLQNSKDSDIPLRARAWAYLGNIERRLRDNRAARRSFETAYGFYKQLVVPLETLRVLRNLGVVADALGDTDAASWYEQALAMPTKDDQAEDRAVVHNNLGDLYRRLGRLPDALAQHNAALTLRRDVLKDAVAVADSQNNLALVHRERGDLEAALIALEAARTIWSALPDSRQRSLLVAGVDNNLAAVYSDLGKFAQARDRYRAVRTAYIALKSVEGEARTLDNIGAVLSDLGDLTQAQRSHEVALKLWRELKDDLGIAMSEQNLAVVLATQGQSANALVLQNRSLTVLRTRGGASDIANALINRADTLRLLKQLPEADADAQAALVLRRQINNVREVAYALAVLGHIADERGDGVSAERYYDEAVGLLDSTTAQSIRDPAGVGPYQEILRALHTHAARSRLRRGLAADALAMLEQGRAQGLRRSLARARVVGVSARDVEQMGVL